MTIEELRVLITAQTDEFNRQINGIRRQLNNVDTSANKIGKSIKSAFNVAKVTAFAYAVSKVVSVTTELASRLEEVQNVVEVSFGEMSSQVNTFAQNAIKQFGMSEYSAKKAASTFMAMGNGMGVAAKEGATMAITLAGLSGDLASFWNTSQEMAETALASVYTGETETLKKYGVVLTETNLKQYAMTKGITKSYEALSQAEKVMLRYAYVLEATKNAQGDFQRTSNSWANQIRILKEQWNQLLSIIGQALTKILGPVVQFLNKILSQVITIANAISKAFANIFGTKETTMKVETNADTSQADKNFGNTTEAVEGTTEAVEDLNKQLDLASFDEIERIGQLKDEQEEDAGDFNLDIGEIEIEESEVGDGLIDQIGERLQSILDTIAEAIKNFKDRIPKLDLQFDIDKFLDNLTRLVNAFITAFGNILTAAATFAINLANAINWDAVFTNLTNAAISAISILETIFVTAFTLLDKIAQDIQLGAIITQITALIAAFMNLADVIVSTLAPALIAFYDTGLKPIVEWIGEKLLDAIQFAIDLFNDWAAWFEENTEGIENLGRVLGELVNTLWRLLEPIADTAWEVFKEIIITISEIFQTFFGWIIENAEVVIAAITGIVTAFLAYRAVLGITALIEAFTNGTLLAAAAARVMAIAQAALNVVMSANPIALVVAAIAGLVTAFTVLWNTSEEFRAFWQGLWDGIVSIVQGAVSVVSSIIDSIVSAIQGVVSAAKDLLGIGDSKTSGSYSSGGFSGGNRRALNYSYVPASIPTLASGGVLYDTTIAMMGEYPGANSNPEIVTPQNIMMETMEQANAGIINAVMAVGSKVTKAIEDKDSNIYMDGTKVTRKIMSTQEKLQNYKGTSLVKK